MNNITKTNETPSSGGKPTKGKHFSKRGPRRLIIGAALALTCLGVIIGVNAASSYTYSGTGRHRGSQITYYADSSSGRGYTPSHNNGDYANLKLSDSSYMLSTIDCSPESYYYSSLENITDYAIHIVDADSAGKGYLYNSFYWLPQSKVKSYSRMAYAKLFKVPANSKGHAISFGGQNVQAYINVYEYDANLKETKDGGWVTTSATDLYTIKSASTRYILLYFKVADGDYSEGSSISEKTNVTVKDIWDKSNGVQTYFVYRPMKITLDNQEATTAGSGAVYERYMSSITRNENDTPMTTKANPITVPKKTGYVFKGYYTEENGEGTQIINSKGFITSDFKNNLFKVPSTAYAYWEPDTFTIYYHANDDAPAAEATTEVTYKTLTPTLKHDSKELNFSKYGYHFIGWKVYRKYDNTYRVTNAAGNWSWSDKVPSGGKYYLYSDGTSVDSTAPSGEVHFYAQWAPNTFTVQYHSSDSAAASTKTTVVTYGKSTATKTLSELGFSNSGYTFIGWKAYRDYDKKYIVEDSKGTISWQTSLPSGSSYSLYNEGASIAKTAPSGVVHFYAQWVPNSFVVKYHLTDSAAASPITTVVTYGKSTATKTLADLQFTNPGYSFVGWKAYREYDNKYYVRDAGGVESWQSVLPAKGNYSLYKEGTSIARTAPSGVVHFYGQWASCIYTVTLDQTGATTDGTAAYYEKYNIGNYSARECTTAITSVTIPIRKHYLFEGYYTGVDGTGVQYVDKDGKILSTSTTFRSNVTLYAKWTPNWDPSYGVTATITCKTPEALTAKKDVILLGRDYSAKITGYYWGKTNPESTSVTYTGITPDEDDSITLEETVTSGGRYYFSIINAEGETTTESILFIRTNLEGNGTKSSPVSFSTEDNNSVNGVPSQLNIINPAGTKVTLPEGTRTGYHGNTYRSGNGKSGTWSKNRSAATGEKVLTVNEQGAIYYMVWIADRYTLTLDVNKPSGAETETDLMTAEYTAGNDKGLTMSSGVELTERYYTVIYDNNNIEWNTTGAVKKAIDRAAAAGWELEGWYDKPQYSITYNLKSVDKEEDRETHSGEKVFNADGSKVVGAKSYWSGTASESAVWRKSEAVTLYAHWRANKYTVTLDGNKNDGGKQCAMTLEKEGVISGGVKTLIGDNKFIAVYDLHQNLPNTKTEGFTLTKEDLPRTWDEQLDCVPARGKASFQSWGTDAFSTPTVREEETQKMWNLTTEASGAETLYAKWDHYPTVVPLWKISILQSKLEEYKNNISAFEKYLDAQVELYDYEDGTDIEVTFEDSEYVVEQLTLNKGSINCCTAAIWVKDKFGNERRGLVEVWSQPDKSQEDIDADPDQVQGEVKYPRAISKEFYMTYYEHKDDEDESTRYSWDTYRDYGGLRPTSIWYQNPEYSKRLLEDFDKLENDIYTDSYTFTHEQVLATQLFTGGDKIYEIFVDEYGEKKTEELKALLNGRYTPEGHPPGVSADEFGELIEEWDCHTVYDND